MRWRLVAILGLGAACAQPPTEELALVEERIETARSADAAIFAPELLALSESGLSEARRLVEEEGEHRAAIRTAAAASLAAEDAFTTASSARAVVLRHLERIETELRALLEMAASRGAPAGEIRALRERCDRVREIAETGDLLGALYEAEALKPELVAFEQRYR